MPLYDRRRSIDVPIDFCPIENFKNLPHNGCVTLILITDGKAIIYLNGQTKTLITPSVLLLSDQDSIEVIENNRLYAQSFTLNPSYLKNRKTYRAIKKDLLQSNIESAIDVLNLFFYRDASYIGILGLPPEAYIKILEWMAVIGQEITAQSDSRWTCRVRAYFLQILNMLDEIYLNRKTDIFANKPYSNVDVVLEYIHTHYMDDISLESLCSQTHTNRTTLNRSFKERTGQTTIAYLLNYRLRAATELLAHTGLTIDEIAKITGFSYGTYLIKRFTAKTGETPTEYRLRVRQENNIVIINE